MMKHTHKPLKNKKTVFALFMLIVFPLFVALIMWSILPSGYQRYKDKSKNSQELSSINPFVRGIKPLTFFLWQ